MKHLAAYLLLVLGGNDSPTAKDIKNVLESVGIEADDDRIKKLLGEVKGKDLNDVCHSFPPTPPFPFLGPPPPLHPSLTHSLPSTFFFSRFSVPHGLLENVLCMI